MSLPTSHRSRLLDALAAATEEAPTARKLLLAPTRGGGRELLRSLARSGTSWLGWEVLTARPLALEIVAGRLAEAGRDVLDEVGEDARLDAALEGALQAAESAAFTELAEGVGFRRAMRDAVRALRLAGIGPARLRRDGPSDPEKRELLAAALERYESGLDRDDVSDGVRWVDTAFVLGEAVRALKAGDPTGFARIWIVPGVSGRGLGGRLVRTLEARGARRLSADPVVGVPPSPSMVWEGAEAASPLSFLSAPGRMPAEGGAPAGSAIDLFHAGSVNDELREVLRRAMRAGLRWDEVEIVATDAGVYGSALHGLAARLDVPVTFGVGLPVERTRAGQAVAAWTRWIREGFPSAVLRGLLQAGLLVPPRPHRSSSGPALARRLRALRIGWGRARYVPALRAALDRREGPAEPGRKETEEEARARMRRECRQLEAILALVEPVLDAVPPLPDRFDDPRPPVSPAALATGLRTFLSFVPGRGEVDRTALERLTRILLRVEAELTRPAPFSASLATLERYLEIRVPAPRAEGPAPWRSNGGHLYLTDLEHGGLSGRRATFVVGLDAQRASAGRVQDPILLDAERRRLDADALPTSGARAEDQRFLLSGLLARLRGRVTLSYAAWDPTESRSRLPSPLLLQAFRVARRDARLGYRELREALGDPVSAVPRDHAGESGETAGLVDAQDVWLAALDREGSLRAGESAVRDAYPFLDAGLAMRDAAEGPPSIVHGVLPPAPELDPRRSGAPVSASRLECLGACPRRYFLRYVLELYPPRDPEHDPDVWLDALERGSLLHDVYERTLLEARRREVALDSDAFPEVAVEVLEDAAATVEARVPPPSRVVRDRELEALREDVLAFVEMTRRDGDRWREVEFSFGMPGSPLDPVELGVPGGRIFARGAVDRIDVRGGALHLIDYKTGRPGRFRKGGSYHGGRRLQHVLYTRVAQALFDEPVRGLSYRFPTRRAENASVDFRTAELGDGLELVGRLLDGVAAGTFVPTDDASDCRFCDYRSICKVKDAAWGDPESPLADWAASRLDAPALAQLAAVRGWEER